MKKNLLYLWALICSVSLLTACSSDDDNTVNDETTPPEEEAVVTAPDVVGTYWGNLDISMLPDGSDQEVVIADGLPKFITFSQVSDTEVKMELKEFELFINGNILKVRRYRNRQVCSEKGNGRFDFHRTARPYFSGGCRCFGYLCHQYRRNGAKWKCYNEYSGKSTCIEADRESCFLRCEAGGGIR